MKCSFLSDLKAAKKAFQQSRAERKAEIAERKAGIRTEMRNGFVCKIHPLAPLPVMADAPIDGGSLWGWTMEGALFSGNNRTAKAVFAVFQRFDEETQHALTFTPKDQGEWADRAQFWQRALKPQLPPLEYYAAISKILNWYITCIKRKAVEV